MEGATLARLDGGHFLGGWWCPAGPTDLTRIPRPWPLQSARAEVVSEAAKAPFTFKPEWERA